MARRVQLFALTALIALAAVARGAPAEGTTPLFERDTLALSINSPTSLAFGPDGRLYVAAIDEIRALTLDPETKEVVAVEQIASGLDDVLGIAFDPTAPASPVALYASHRDATRTDGFESVISRYTAPDWVREDVITGLPTSRPYLNHTTNGLAFDAQGRLFIAQGSNTDAGLAVPYWPETPLSAAILIAEIHAPGFNGAIVYSPVGPPNNDEVNQTQGDVSVFASGLRNPYDLVLHSNGYIYATDNGPMGPSYSASCNAAASGVSTSDELNLVEAGNYYGHPNRNRGGADTRQCTYHGAQAGSGTGFTGPIAVLPSHCSCDGIAEYASAALGGTFLGDLIYAEFSGGKLSRAELSVDGRSVLSTTVLDSGFSLPLDVTVGLDGTIYVAEYGGNRVAYLQPQAAVGGVALLPEAVAPAAGDGIGWPVLAVAAAGAVALTIAARRAARRLRFSTIVLALRDFRE